MTFLRLQRRVTSLGGEAVGEVTAEHDDTSGNDPSDVPATDNHHAEDSLGR